MTSATPAATPALILVLSCIGSVVGAGLGSILALLIRGRRDDCPYRAWLDEKRSEARIVAIIARERLRDEKNAQRK